MADAKRAAFSSSNAALSFRQTKDITMVEVLFMAQLVRRPLQAMARRWYCRSLFRASRGALRCPECTAS
jgi:CxxC motif-containing protein (DUF1111 family)